MFRTILKLLTVLALGAFASASLAQQAAAPASQPVPYLNAQARTLRRAGCVRANRTPASYCARRAD